MAEPFEPDDDAPLPVRPRLEVTNPSAAAPGREASSRRAREQADASPSLGLPGQRREVSEPGKPRAKSELTPVRADALPPAPVAAASALARPAIGPLDPDVVPSKGPLDPVVPPARPPPVTRPSFDFDPVMAPARPAALAKVEGARPAPAPASASASASAPAPAPAAVAGPAGAVPFASRLLASPRFKPAAGLTAAVVVVWALSGSATYSAEERARLGLLWRDKAAPQLVSDIIAVDAIRVVRDSIGGSRPRGTPEQRLRVVHQPGAHVFALVDGTLVISVDLLQVLHSEVELAAVLAHAQAHYDLGHIDRLLVTHTHLMSKVRDELDAKGSTAKALATAALGATETFTVDEEIAADAFAIASLKLGAWDGRGLRSVLEGLGRSPAGEAWLAHHPMDPTRSAAWAATETGTDEEIKRVNVAEYETRVLDRLFPSRPRPRLVVPVVAAPAEVTPWKKRTFEPAPG